MVGGYPITVDQHILPKAGPMSTALPALYTSIFGEILICIKKKMFLKVDRIRSI